MLSIAERRLRLKEIFNGFTLPEVSDAEPITRPDRKPGVGFFGATTRSGRGLSTDDVRAIVDEFEAAPRGRAKDSLVHGCVCRIARKWRISEKRARQFWYAHLEASNPPPSVIYTASLAWPDFDGLPIGARA